MTEIKNDNGTLKFRDSRDVFVEIELKLNLDNSVESILSCYKGNEFGGRYYTWRDIQIPKERMSDLIQAIIDCVRDPRFNTKESQQKSLKDLLYKKIT